MKNLCRSVVLLYLWLCLTLSSLAWGVAGDCSAYTSPSGSAGYPGTLNAPTSLASAFNNAVSGDVVCLKGGTYSRNTTFAPAHTGNGVGVAAGPPTGLP